MEGLIGILLGGLLVGAVARLALPGPQPIGCFGTMAIGIAGGALGGWLGHEVIGVGEGALAGFVYAVIGAVLLLMLLRAVAGRSR